MCPVIPPVMLQNRGNMDLNTYLLKNRIYKQDFCKTIDICVAHMSLICNHKRMPSYKLIQRIHDATKGKVTAKDWEKIKKEEK